MDLTQMDTQAAEAAGLLQRCRLLTKSAGTTNQTWSIDDYLIALSDIKFTRKVIGNGLSTKVEEVELFGMLCAAKMPHDPKPEPTECEENEGPKSLNLISDSQQCKLPSESRGWTVSNHRSSVDIKKKIPIRKIRSHSFQPVSEDAVASLAHTSRLTSKSDGLNGFSKIMKECRMLSTLHHPNIVQFYGVCWLEGEESGKTPVIVEELMLLSLKEVTTSFKEKLGAEIPLSMKLSLLSDTARGLAYLHNHAPSIIHPNLHASDVMVSPAMVAKITDLCDAQYGSTKHQDVLAFGLIAALTLGLSPEQISTIQKDGLSDVEADLIKMLVPCFSSDNQARPGIPKLLNKLEQLVKRVPFQLSQMGAMMAAIRDWRQEADAQAQAQAETKMPVSRSVQELLEQKDRQLEELQEKNTELMATNETIEKKLEEQAEQLQRTQSLESSGPGVQLSGMLADLHDVIGWFVLGIHLGVPLSDLQKIRHQHNENVDKCKTEMLITYTRLKEPSWRDIVEALWKSGEHALATRLSEKYRTPLPESVTTSQEAEESSLLPEGASETESQVNELVRTIRDKDGELQSTVQQLQREQATKEDLEKELVLLRESLSSIDVHGVSFHKDKQLLSQQLFLKERERHYLSLVGMGQQNHKEKNMHGNEIDVILVEKDMEINRMRTQLKEMETQFIMEKTRSSELNTRLSSLESEIVIKDAHIIELQKSKEELNRYLGDERHRVDMLLMKVIPPPASVLTPPRETSPPEDNCKDSLEPPLIKREPTPAKNCCVIS